METSENINCRENDGNTTPNGEKGQPNFVSALDEILRNRHRAPVSTSSGPIENQDLINNELTANSPRLQSLQQEEISVERSSVPDRKFAFFQYFFGPSYSVYETLGRLYLAYLLLPVIIALVFQLAPCFTPNQTIDLSSPLDEGIDEMTPGVKATVSPKTNWAMGSLAIINTVSAIFFVDKWRSLLQETNLKLIAKSIHAGTFSISRFDFILKERPGIEPSILTWWELTGKKYVVALPLTVFLALFDVFCVYRVIHLWVESEGTEGTLYERTWLENNLFPIPDRKMLIGVVLLWTITWLFVELARFLTAWENPQSHSDYVSSLVGKTAFFAFVVNFSPVHYIHCFLRNAEKTQVFVLTLLLVFAVLDIVNDLLCCLKGRGRRGAGSSINATIDEHDNAMYKDNVNVFLPLFIQIGLVFMFSTVVPLILPLSFLFNLLSLPLKAHRIQSLSNNEILQTSLEALQWQDVLCMLLALALLANCQALNEAAAVTDLQNNLGSLFAWSILLLHIFMIVGVVVVIMPDNNLSKEAAIIRRMYREIKATRPPPAAKKSKEKTTAITPEVGLTLQTPLPEYNKEDQLIQNKVSGIAPTLSSSLPEANMKISNDNEATLSERVTITTNSEN